MGVSLSEVTRKGVRYLTDPAVENIRFGFTERMGGVSEVPYLSLNLGDRVGDAPSAVAENRRRALAALGMSTDLDRLINPKQVHGSEVLVLDSSDASHILAVQTRAQVGADGIVCTVPGVASLLCFADCVPVCLVTPHGFALLHSGWRGTKARISRIGLEKLLEATGDKLEEVRAYIGPHIGPDDYEVGEELRASFAQDFGEGVIAHQHNLDLKTAIVETLEEAGLQQEQIAACDLSTAQNTDKFYSYRAEKTVCGRHGALAEIVGEA